MIQPSHGAIIGAMGSLPGAFITAYYVIAKLGETEPLTGPVTSMAVAMFVGSLSGFAVVLVGTLIGIALALLAGRR